LIVVAKNNSAQIVHRYRPMLVVTPAEEAESVTSSGAPIPGGCVV
jgi:hypothetical protein